MTGVMGVIKTHKEAFQCEIFSFLNGKWHKLVKDELYVDKRLARD